MLFFKIWYFLSVQIVFQFVTQRSEIRLKFWASKAAFWWNSVIINFLENKRYSAKRSMLWLISHWDLLNFEIWAKLIFQLLPPNVWPLVTFVLKFHLPFGLFVTRIYMIYFRELDDHPSEEGCSMSQFPFANNVEPTASFDIILLFLTINFRDDTWRGKRIKRTGKFWFRPSERTKHDHSQYKRSFSREGVFTIWQKTACRRIFGKSSGDLQRIHTTEW